MNQTDSRKDCYIVMRYPTSQTSAKQGVPLGAFLNWEEADNYAGACAQELQEKIGYGAYFCKVELTTLYG